MAKVTVIIPSRNEVYESSPGITVLQRTVMDILSKATGDIEVIVAFDGPPYQSLPVSDRVIALHLPQSGTRHNFNLAAKLASGKYLMKLDSHCSVSPGFDEVLVADMEDNWVVTPRFYVLDPLKWQWQDSRHYDYFYLPCPFTDPRLFRFQAGGHWIDRTRERETMLLDENMKLHGSSFFLARDFFLNCLGGLQFQAVDGFSGEDIEISLKTWLGPWDGKLMVNKKAWYAHMHKGSHVPRGFHVSNSATQASYLQIANYWMGNEWNEAAKPLSWLVDHFYPVPTWPTNWKELYQEWIQKQA